MEFNPQRSYQIRISVRNQQDSPLDSVWSEVIEVQTIAPVPVAPGGPRTSEVTHNSVRVSWDAPTNDGAERIHNWASTAARRMAPRTATPTGPGWGWHPSRLLLQDAHSNEDLRMVTLFATYS